MQKNPILIHQVKNNFKTMGGRAGIDFGKWDYNFNQTEWIKNSVSFMDVIWFNERMFPSMVFEVESDYLFNKLIIFY